MPDSTDNTLGQRIRRLRLEATPRITQIALAERCRVSRQSVNLWERDCTSPGGECLLAAAEHLGVSPRYLLTGEEGPNTQPNLDESLLKAAVTHALKQLAAANRSVEDDPAGFAKAVASQYRNRLNKKRSGRD